MAKMVYEILNITTERIDALCEEYLGKEGQFSDIVIKNIFDSDLILEEKMALAFAIGFMSAMDFASSPYTIIKANDIVH